MPAPCRADTGTFTTPVGAVSPTEKAGRKNRPVADSTRPGCDTTSVGAVAPVRLWMSYDTRIVAPRTTGSTIGARTLFTVPLEGPRVSVTLAVATVALPSVAV